MVRDDIAQTIMVGIHFAFLGAVTLATAQPFLFPSLGPSAYLLAAGEGENEAQSGPYHVIGGHLVSVVAGLIGYHTLASGLVVVNVLETATAFSGAILRLGASSIVAMMLTTIGMLLTDTNHPAACATTLIVSLGILSSPTEATVIMLAVVALVAVHELFIYPAAERLWFEPENPRENNG